MAITGLNSYILDLTYLHTELGNLLGLLKCMSSDEFTPTNGGYKDYLADRVKYLSGSLAALSNNMGSLKTSS